ncbi:hypothetical protein E2C01_041497 [Portunus trituberculatus]|uniref:Uncharacterized protein n=1 Tax=Portunus trituberculatus TaxID=210409 RepID=A0A5B7FK52_PORTR|nr:hypothetical protein [Portunus trituberculatus]
MRGKREGADLANPRNRADRSKSCEEPLETCERGGDEAGGAERPMEATLEDGSLTDSEVEETSLPDASTGRDLPNTAVKEKPAPWLCPTLPSSVSPGTIEGTESIPGCLVSASPGKPDDLGVTSIETPSGLYLLENFVPPTETG